MKFLAALLVANLAFAADRVLVENGRSRYEIVCAADANPATQLAAKELRMWVKQSTGVDLPLATAPTAGKAHVFIGASEWAGKVDNLPPESYRLHTVGDDVQIVGVDVMRGALTPKRSSATQTGTLFGVYDFLERCFGVMFLWHDPLGTIVPKHERVVVPDLAIETAPAWTYRHLAYSPEGQAGEGIFGRRLRLGHHYTVAHSHSWFQIAPIEKYGAAHPEWYAEIDGQRKPAYYMQHHGGQVCTTNPEVIDLFAKAAIEFFNTSPGRDMFSLSPNDGGGFCACAKCRALDNGMRPDGKPIMTDRLITFYNAIAERVAQVHPTKLLGAYAYSFYREPPEKVQPHPNLYIVHATNTAFHQGVGWPEEREIERKWRSGTKHLAKYDIYYSPDSSLNMIAPMTKHLVEKVRAESTVGIEGGYLYMGQSYEQLGAGHFLLARLMWDPKADAAALAQSYYRALYGAAAAEIQQYYDLLESRLARQKHAPLDTKLPVVRMALRKHPGIGSPAYILAAYAPILDDATALIEKARSRDLQAEERARMQRLLDQHELLVTTVRGMFAAGKIESDANTTADEAAAFLELVAQRQAVRERLKTYAPSLCQNLEIEDHDGASALNPSGALVPFARALATARPSAGRMLEGGDFEKASVKANLSGGATAEVTTDAPRAGKQSLRVRVPEGGMASVTLTAKVKPLTAYRVTLAHWNEPATDQGPAGDDADAITRGTLPIAPRTRVIFRDEKGKTVGKNEWSGPGAHEHVKEWHTFPHLLRTAEGVRQISFTTFFQYPGTYLLNEVKIEEL